MQWYDDYNVNTKIDIAKREILAKLEEVNRLLEERIKRIKEVVLPKGAYAL